MFLQRLASAFAARAFGRFACGVTSNWPQWSGVHEGEDATRRKRAQPSRARTERSERRKSGCP